MVTHRENLHVALAAAIGAGRKSKGLSQAALGRLLGVTRQAVNMWESGKNIPDLERLPTILEAVGWERSQIADWLARTFDLAAEVEPLTDLPDIETFTTRCPQVAKDRFLINNTSQGYTKRPPLLRRGDLVRCILLDSLTMMPWRFHEDPVFYDLLRTPRLGGFALIAFRMTDDPNEQVGAGTLFAVKLLTDLRDDAYRVKQFFPEEETTIARRDTLAAYKVLDWTDLYGPFPST